MANSISAATGGKGGAAPGDIISNVLLEFRVLAVDNLSDPTPRYYCTYSSPLLPALTSPQQSSSLSFSKPSTEHNFLPFLYLATGYRLLLRIIHYPLSIIQFAPANSCSRPAHGHGRRRPGFPLPLGEGLCAGSGPLPNHSGRCVHRRNHHLQHDRHTTSSTCNAWPTASAIAAQPSRPRPMTLQGSVPAHCCMRRPPLPSANMLDAIGRDVM
jgi:hypothetical protein